MVTKRLLSPVRMRAVPSQFSWLDHRLVRERHLDRCSTEALALLITHVVMNSATDEPERRCGRQSRKGDFFWGLLPALPRDLFA